MPHAASVQGTETGIHAPQHACDMYMQSCRQRDPSQPMLECEQHCRNWAAHAR